MATSIKSISIPHGFDDGSGGDLKTKIAVGDTIDSQTITSITATENPKTGFPFYSLYAGSFQIGIVFNANGAIYEDIT